MAKKANKALKHLAEEEKRQFEALQELDPATNEYGLGYAQWEHSLHNLKDFDDSNGELKLKWWQIVLFTGATLAAPIIGDRVLKIAESPYIRDTINKVTLGNHIPKPKFDFPNKKGH